MDDIKLLSTSLRPYVVLVGVPRCWVDGRRVAQLLVRSPANDNDRFAIVAGGAK